MVRVNKTKRKRFRKDPTSSKYTLSKENCCHLSTKLFISENVYQRLIAGARLHTPPNLKDLLVDSALRQADISISEHPEILSQMFENPTMFHPEGKENIFKAKDFQLDIITEDDDGRNPDS